MPRIASFVAVDSTSGGMQFIGHPPFRNGLRNPNPGSTTQTGTVFITFTQHEKDSFGPLRLIFLADSDSEVWNPHPSSHGTVGFAILPWTVSSRFYNPARSHNIKEMAVQPNQSETAVAASRIKGLS